MTQFMCAMTQCADERIPDIDCCQSWCFVPGVLVCLCVWVCTCMRACVCARMRSCLRACVRVFVCAWRCVCRVWHVYDVSMSHFAGYTEMSHVTHVSASSHTYEWVMSHIRMNHVTQMNYSDFISVWRIKESFRKSVVCRLDLAVSEGILSCIILNHVTEVTKVLSCSLV